MDAGLDASAAPGKEDSRSVRTKAALSALVQQLSAGRLPRRAIDLRRWFDPTPEPEEITLGVKRVPVSDTFDSPLQLEERGTLVFHAVCEPRGGLHHE
jgi:hypothetical protein